MTDTDGSPFAPHTAAETDAMLSTLGVDSETDLFDIPETVAFDGEFGIEARSEQEIRGEIQRLFRRNDDLTEFMGRGHYSHYVPSLVDHLSDRTEFLTSYTQYQPEITQGFLQALFEYQSMLVELTGLPVANCSMYDAATGLAEAALLADRVRETTGDTCSSRSTSETASDLSSKTTSTARDWESKPTRWTTATSTARRSPNLQATKR